MKTANQSGASLCYFGIDAIKQQGTEQNATFNLFAIIKAVYRRSGASLMLPCSSGDEYNSGTSYRNKHQNPDLDTCLHESLVFKVNVYQPVPLVSLNHLTRAGIDPKNRVKNNKPTRAPILTWSRYSIPWRKNESSGVKSAA